MTSKVHGRSSGLFGEIANITLADALETRLRELERDIAVARQFIELADEAYSQIRHEWDILQLDIRRVKSPDNTKTSLELSTARDHIGSKESSGNPRSDPKLDSINSPSLDDDDEGDEDDGFTEVTSNPNPTKTLSPKDERKPSHESSPNHKNNPRKSKKAKA